MCINKMNGMELSAAANTIALYICGQFPCRKDRLLISSFLSQISDTVSRVTVQEDLLKSDIPTAAEDAVIGEPFL